MWKAQVCCCFEDFEQTRYFPWCSVSKSTRWHLPVKGKTEPALASALPSSTPKRKERRLLGPCCPRPQLMTVRCFRTRPGHPGHPRCWEGQEERSCCLSLRSSYYCKVGQIVFLRACCSSGFSKLTVLPFFFFLSFSSSSICWRIRWK